MAEELINTPSFVYIAKKFDSDCEPNELTLVISYSWNTALREILRECKNEEEANEIEHEETEDETKELPTTEDELKVILPDYFHIKKFIPGEELQIYIDNSHFFEIEKTDVEP